MKASRRWRALAAMQLAVPAAGRDITVQALKDAGAPLGAAIIGSVLATGYQAQLQLAGLPAAAARAAKAGLFGGVTVARQLDSASLPSVRAAFVHGMDTALLVSAAIAAPGVVPAPAFLPARPKPSAAAQPPQERHGSRAVTR